MTAVVHVVLGQAEKKVDLAGHQNVKSVFTRSESEAQPDNKMNESATRDERTALMGVGWCAFKDLIANHFLLWLPIGAVHKCDHDDDRKIRIAP